MRRDTEPKRSPRDGYATLADGAKRYAPPRDGPAVIRPRAVAGPAASRTRPGPVVTVVAAPSAEALASQPSRGARKGVRVIDYSNNPPPHVPDAGGQGTYPEGR